MHDPAAVHSAFVVDVGQARAVEKRARRAGSVNNAWQKQNHQIKPGLDIPCLGKAGIEWARFGLRVRVRGCFLWPQHVL